MCILSFGVIAEIENTMFVYAIINLLSSLAGLEHFMYIIKCRAFTVSRMSVMCHECNMSSFSETRCRLRSHNVVQRVLR